MTSRHELTDEQRRACEAAGVPVPPSNVEWHGDSLCDWRRPNPETQGPKTPTSFRWRFSPPVFECAPVRLIAFCAYAWHSRRIGYGRATHREPVFGYSILHDPAIKASVVEQAFTDPAKLK